MLALDLPKPGKIRENPMSSVRMIFLTSLAMIAFAGNSLLCRAALKHTGIDPTNFTTIRLTSLAILGGIALVILEKQHAHCSR
jgi:hypothetical protein